MRYKRLEDLPVWNDAIELAVQVYALTSRPELTKERSGLIERPRSVKSFLMNLLK